MHTFTTAKYASHNNLQKAELSREAAVRAILVKKSHWTSQEDREAYMEAAVEQGIAWQIRLNREQRNWSQRYLAELIGTQQSAISRLEDPAYGAHSTETLVAVAKAFDCALLVKFISYSDLALESQKLSEIDQFAAPFSAEREKFRGKAQE